MEEKKEYNKDNNSGKTREAKDLKFKLGDIKGFEEAIKRLNLNDKNNSSI